MASTKKKANSSRKTRAQESRAAEVVHESYEEDFSDKGLLDTTHIPERPGYVQRWVRTKLNGLDDPNNVGRKYNQGWRPRLADSVPKGKYVPTIEHQRFGNVIGVEGMILMERPEKVHEMHARRNMQATKNQQRAVDENMFQEHVPGKGFTKPERSGGTTVEIGRPIQVADDFED